MSPAAALLTILAKADLSETEVTIKPELDALGCPVFTLFSADGLRVARSDHPKALVKYAWANGASKIRHPYDLKLAE